MTTKKPYTFLMNTLLVSSGLGIVWLVLLFALCFGAVHIAKLAKYGQEYRKQNQNKTQAEAPPPEPNKKAPPPDTREPIYYIVERKRKTISSFSEPKEIRFK